MLSPNTRAYAKKGNYEEKDLRSTRLSFKMFHNHNNSYRLSRDVEMGEWRLPIITSHIYCSTSPSSYRRQYILQNTTLRNTQPSRSQTNLVKRKINWTYSSPNKQPQQNQSCNPQIAPQANTAKMLSNSKSFQNFAHLSRTPSKVSNKTVANSKNKIIHSLHEASTVESKYLLSTTPKHSIQESEIVFKGSKDIQKLIPIKLVYQQQEQPKVQHKIEQVNKLVLDLKLIRKSNGNVCLCALANTNSLYSLIKIEQAFCLENLQAQRLMKIYDKCKIEKSSYIVCEPYEYTLNELIKSRKIKGLHINIICEFLKPAIQILCRDNCSFFEVQQIENFIFYIHGMFKLVPIFPKGKLQTIKTESTTLQELKNYLKNLINI